MKVQIQSIHFTADIKLEDVIKAKLTKLETFYDRIIDAEVFLKIDKDENKNNKEVEIKMNVPGANLFAKNKKASFEAAAEECTEALRRQLKKFKEKQLTH